MKKAAIIGMMVLACAVMIISIAVAQQPKRPHAIDHRIPKSWYDKSVALVVGIDQYKNGWTSLTGASKDANHVAGALRSQGFEVILLTDQQATKDAIMTKIRADVPAMIGKNGRFVFYYVGQSQTQKAAHIDKQAGFLVPADGRKVNGADDWSSYISLDDLRSQINMAIKAKHVLVVFESSFFVTAQFGGGLLSETAEYFLASPAYNVLAAGNVGQPNPIGVFADDFVDAINGRADGMGGPRDGFVSFAELGMYIQSRVPAKVPGLTPSFGWWDGTSQVLFQYSAEAIPPSSIGSAGNDQQTPDLSVYDDIIETENRRILESPIQERVDRQAKQEAIEQAYQKLKDYRNGDQYEEMAKRMVYRRFLIDFPEENPYYDVVYAWLGEPDAASGMAMIPGGWFFMGCEPDDERCTPDEKPRRRIYVDSFYLDVHEVTVKEYWECADAGGCTEPKLPKHIKDEDDQFFNCDKQDRGDHPINAVSWNEAAAYCRWKGKRLPSEAEFEYVLHGLAENDPYPWGNAESPPALYGNYKGTQDGYVGTAPVCSMKKSVYGLYDISGNVSEWCRDNFSDSIFQIQNRAHINYRDNWYYEMPERNPVNDRYSEYRVVRGGSWTTDGRVSRSAARGYSGVDSVGPNIGFRCARN